MNPNFISLKIQFPKTDSHLSYSHLTKKEVRVEKSPKYIMHACLKVDSSEELVWIQETVRELELVSVLALHQEPYAGIQWAAAFNRFK